MAIPVDVLQTGAQFDADTYSLKYFGVSENFTRLKRGKNTITLSPSIFLKRDSPIEVELYLKDGDGQEVSYPVEFPDKVTSNGTTFLEINITDDVPLTSATLYIAGIMRINVDTGENYGDPTEFNLVWKGFSRMVDNDDDELSPCSSCNDTVLDRDIGDIKIDITPQDCTYREPAEDRNTNLTGTGTLTYFAPTETSQTNNSIEGGPTRISNKANIGITNSSDSLSGTYCAVSQPVEGQVLPIISSTVAEFTSDMVGAIITVNSFSILRYVSADTAGDIPPTGTFSATIAEVVNNKTVRVNEFFKITIPATETRGARIITQFDSSDYTVRYSKNVASSAGQKITGCAKLCFDNVATANGQIAGVAVKAKPVGGMGGAVDLGTFKPNFGNKLEDTSNYEYSPTGGAQYKSAGAFKSQSDVTTYLEVKDYKEKTTASSNAYTKDYEFITNSSATQSDDNIINAAAVDEPNANETRLISIKDSYLGAAKNETEYSLQFDLFPTKVSSTTPEIEIYIQGPSIEGQSNTTPFGTYLKTYTSADGRLLKGEKITFKTTSASNSIKPNFLIKGGKWEVANVTVLPDSSTKNSPNEFCITVPLDGLATNVIGEEFIFEVDFIGSNGRPLNLNLTTQNIILNQDATIDERLIINTFNSSTLLQGIISGSGAWTISDGSTESVIKNEETLTITGDGVGVSLSGQTLTITGAGASDCTITLQGDGTGICTTIGSFTLDQSTNCTLTVEHSDTSTLCGIYGTNGISSITVDSLGHVTAISTDTFSTEDNYADSLTFSNGCLTLGRTGTLPDLTVSLDGRYCTTDNNTTYTANEMLTCIKTVDGASSGLDADLLDGNEASAFYLATNPSGYTTCTGTVTSVATGTGLTGGTITSTGTISLSHLGLESLTDPNADRVAFWDDSAGAFAWLTMGSNLSISSTTLNATDTNTTYTANDMLTCIKTVDGASSGLDADLLDGQQGTYYLDYNNLTNTPTISTLSITNCTNNNVLTATGNETTINGESNMTFDGSTLNITGQACLTSCVTADNFITTSDRRLKSNIEPLKDGIEVLKQFNSYIYTKSGYVDAGFIAQEVCEVIPYSVGENSEGFLTMRDRPILAYLHSAVIELSTKIDCLEKKLNS